jgi:hypothetical protein
MFSFHPLLPDLTPDGRSLAPFSRSPLLGVNGAWIREA